MTHSPDCALIQYGHLDPATLKQPLICDCNAEDVGDPVPGEEPVDDVPSNVRPIRTADRVTLEGDAARAYRQLQKTEQALRGAQRSKDEALRAFLEAVTR